MNIRDIAREMWEKTKEGPADRWIRIEGFKIRVICMRSVCDYGCHVRFTFAMNHESGNAVPIPLVRRIRDVFIPNGIIYPGENGNLFQYVQEVRMPENYLRQKVRQTMMEYQALEILADDMRKVADRKPFRPYMADVREVQRQIAEYQRQVTIAGVKVNLTLTRTTLIGKEHYHLSIGNDAADPSLIPPQVVLQVRRAFMPTGIQFPSPLGNTLQFMEDV